MLKIKLKDIGVFYNGLKGKNLSDFSDNYPDKYIDFKSILNDNINISELPCVKINEGEQQNVVKRNDLLINMTSENIDDIGLCNIYCYDEKVFLNSFSQGFRVSDNYDPHYISYLLKSPNYRRKIKKQSQGITRINLASSRLGNIDLLIHNYDKQKKIGSFFKELDELIEIYSCIRSNYQDQFQSLLSELSLYLYKNGDKMKISDFFNISSEVNGNENNKVYTISSTNGIIPQDKYFTKEIASRDLSKYKIIKKGQFAYNKSYSKHTPVGCVRKMYDNIGILSPFYMVLSPLSENNLFDYYF